MARKDITPTTGTGYWFAAHLVNESIFHFGYTDVGLTTTADDVSYEFKKVRNQGEVISLLAKHKDKLFEPTFNDPDMFAEPGFYRWDSTGEDEIVWLKTDDVIGFNTLYDAVYAKVNE